MPNVYVTKDGTRRGCIVMVLNQSLHPRLSTRQPPVPPVTTKLTSWQLSVFDILSLNQISLDCVPGEYGQMIFMSRPNTPEYSIIWYQYYVWEVHQFQRQSRFAGVPVAQTLPVLLLWHDDVIKWKHFARYWPFVRGIHRSPVNSPHKGQWRGDLVFSLIYTWTNTWANNGDADDLRRHRAYYDVIVMNIGEMCEPWNMPISTFYNCTVIKQSVPSPAQSIVRWYSDIKLELHELTVTKVLWFWRHNRHWLHRKFSKWQLLCNQWRKCRKMMTFPSQWSPDVIYQFRNMIASYWNYRISFYCHIFVLSLSRACQ